MDHRLCLGQSVQANRSVGTLQGHTGEDRDPEDVLPDLMGYLPSKNMVRRVRVATTNPFTCANGIALMLSTLLVKRNLPLGMLSSTVLQGLSSSLYAGLPTVIATTAESYITELVSLPATSAQRIAVTQAYSKAFRSLFEVMTGISGLGFIPSFTIRSTSLDKILASAHELQGKERNLKGSMCPTIC